MARRTAANFEMVEKSKIDTVSVIDYICPNCGRSMGKITSLGRNTKDKKNSARETEQVCSFCNKKVTIVCY